MKFSKILDRFLKDESGAVTVDWVVLTAAIVGLGIAVGAAVWNSTSTLTGEISTAVDGAGVQTAF